MSLPPQIPAAFKKITPYVKRAEELDKDVNHPESKAVSYYCRAYAMDLSMGLMKECTDTKEVMLYLGSLMDKLEADKKALPVHSPAEGKVLVQEFADKIFTKADEEDQIGVADKNTARTFYAAGVFYDVLQQFKDLLEPEIEKKRKYCKWKAADILNAIKEDRASTLGTNYGASLMPSDADTYKTTSNLTSALPFFLLTQGRAPTPGTGYGGGASLMPSDADGDGGEAALGPAPPLPPPGPIPGPSPTGGTSFDIPQAPETFPASPSPPQVDVKSPTSPPPPSYSSPAPPVDPPPPYSAALRPSPTPAPAPPPVTAVKPPASKPSSVPTSMSKAGSGGVSGGPKQAAMDDAKELCYFAIAALQHKETDLAIDRLEKALQRLKSIK